MHDNVNASTTNIAGLCLLGFTSLLCTAKASERPNVLFIAVDDLKPTLGCYGDTLVKTPNIDRIARNGTVFLSNYCQQAVSGPTRASLMTGMRPDYTQVWDLKTLMRDINPDILTIPQYFASKAYTTQGIGKVFDSRCVDNKWDAPSWTVPYYSNNDLIYAQNNKPAMGRYQHAETKFKVAQYLKDAKAQGIKGQALNKYVEQYIRPTVECVDLPDDAYTDGAIALKSKDILIELKQKNQVFFFAVGFSKPHLPFVAPQKYWDMYNRDELTLATFQEKAVDAPDIAFHQAGELRAYTDIPEFIERTQQKAVGLTLPIEKQKELVHGYYACVSYVDAQIGILLNTLDSLGLAQNTIIVLWGDHGWHLGDHNLWCKHSNFEQATRTPLIISAPGIKAGKSTAVTEFVDVFPTLCVLAGVDVPTHLQGDNLMPIMTGKASKVKAFSVSQYPRTIRTDDAKKYGFASNKVMGYSIRNERYRYTVWIGDDFNTRKSYVETQLITSELYDYVTDPLETANVVNHKAYAVVVSEMKQAMLQFLAQQHLQLNNKQSLR